MTVYQFVGIPVGAAVNVYQRPDGVPYSAPHGTVVATGTADAGGEFTTPDLPDFDGYRASWPSGAGVAGCSPVMAPPPPDAATVAAIAAAIAVQHAADDAAYMAKV